MKTMMQVALMLDSATNELIELSNKKGEFTSDEHDSVISKMSQVLALAWVLGIEKEVEAMVDEGLKMAKEASNELPT